MERAGFRLVRGDEKVRAIFRWPPATSPAAGIGTTGSADARGQRCHGIAYS
jgi:hypothetical protein